MCTFRSTSPASALEGLTTKQSEYLSNDSSRVCVTFGPTSPASALGGLKPLNDSSRVMCTFRSTSPSALARVNNEAALYLEFSNPPNAVRRQRTLHACHWGVKTL